MATVYLGSFLIVHDFFLFTNVKKGSSSKGRYTLGDKLQQHVAATDHSM